MSLIFRICALEVENSAEKTCVWPRTSDRLRARATRRKRKVLMFVQQRKAERGGFETSSALPSIYSLAVG